MKTYIKPNTQTVAISVDNIICTSPGMNDQLGGDQLTRQQDKTNHGVGSGLWSDMK